MLKDHLHRLRRGVAASFAAVLATAAQEVAVAEPAAPETDGASPPPRLRVVTLNAAHGRKERLNQLLLSRARFRDHLEHIGDVLARSEADVVALQEADGPSRWSGGFDHVRTLAEQAGFDWTYRGDHVAHWLARYGTALLSRVPFRNAQSVRFEPTPPTPRKGFVIASLPWPGQDAGRHVDLVSVHFDYLSRRARREQLSRLEEELSKRTAPVIVLGDFNSDWTAAGSVVGELANSAGLTAFEPTGEALYTFRDQRYDWILISEELRFANYAVLPDVVSDHRAVVADIELAAA